MVPFRASVDKPEWPVPFQCGASLADRAFRRHVLRSHGGVAMEGHKIDKPPIDYDLISGDRRYHQEPRRQRRGETIRVKYGAFGSSTHNGIACAGSGVAVKYRERPVLVEARLE
ncbi:hypothetical protein MTO96_004708 [Rhipicephalus appendiculatus]